MKIIHWLASFKHERTLWLLCFLTQTTLGLITALTLHRVPVKVIHTLSVQKILLSSYG